MGAAASLSDLFSGEGTEGLSGEEDVEERDLTLLRIFLLNQQKRDAFVEWLILQQGAECEVPVKACIDLFVDIISVRKNYVYLHNNFDKEILAKYLKPIREQLAFAASLHASVIEKTLSAEARENFDDIIRQGPLGDELLQTQEDLDDMITFLEDVEGELLLIIRADYGRYGARADENVKLVAVSESKDSASDVRIGREETTATDLPAPDPSSTKASFSLSLDTKASLSDLTIALDTNMAGLAGKSRGTKKPSVLVIDDSSRLARLAVSLRLLPDNGPTSEDGKTSSPGRQDATPRQHLDTQLALELMKLKAYDCFVLDLDITHPGDAAAGETGLIDGLELCSMYRVWESSAFVARLAMENQLSSTTAGSISTGTAATGTASWTQSMTSAAAAVDGGEAFVPEAGASSSSPTTTFSPSSPIIRKTKSSFRRSPSARNLKQRCLIIGLSSDVGPEREAAAKQAGMDYLVAKPLYEEAIFDMISSRLTPSSASGKWWTNNVRDN